MLSLSDIPAEESFAPVGKWVLVLNDEINDSFGGMAFSSGISTPTSVQMLKRAIVSIRVIGAYRVDGPECVLGDCSRALRTDASEEAPQPETASSDAQSDVPVEPAPAVEPKGKRK